MDNEILSFQSKDMSFGLQIPQSALNSIYKMCAASSNETGGILIGYYSADFSWAIVTKVTAPPVGSIRGTSTFVREGKSLTRLLDKCWKQKQYYLGEWHYHPNASAEPSNTDKNTMCKLARTASLHCPEPILLIIGGNCNSWTIHCSVFVAEKEIRLI